MDTLIARLNTDTTLDTAYIALSAPRHTLHGSTVTLTDALDKRIGAGYVVDVQCDDNGDRVVSIHALIDGLLYECVVDWDQTRFCDLSEAIPLPTDFDLSLELC